MRAYLPALILLAVAIGWGGVAARPLSGARIAAMVQAGAVQPR